MSAIVASVVVSLLVTGVVAKANGSNLLGDVIKLLGLAKELGNTPTVNESDLGTIFTADDVQTSNFNNIAFASNANHPEYVNGIFEYTETLSNAASTTPLSIKNTWAQDVIAEWTMIMPVGSPSTTIGFSAGTSTVSGVAYGTAITSAPNCSISNVEVATSSKKLVSSNDPSVSTHGPCIVAPNEYFVIYQRSTDPKWSVTSTANPGIDYKYSVRIRTLSTSTIQY